ncbi:acyl-CoA dehydrogenase family protein [Sciscionella marina]|uniref:acyl-CoA dehydrogenase family protein n=1 Tax=Sciscionella marina TaxID=508770 RepID=UPI0003755466|nr:acyl-CoA dehydrogenase family protein [Sciscionella marina]
MAETSGPTVLDDLAFLDELIGTGPQTWDVIGELPVELLRELGAMGLLCAEVPTRFGGLGADSRRNGELTAHIGGLCSSLRSIMTSQGIAATAVRRFGDRAQRQRYLGELTGGTLAAVGFSEPEAGSDLAAMRTRIERAGDTVTVSGEKRWVTGARYADLLLVLGRDGENAAAVLVPSDAPGVTVEPVLDPMGCRAAGHSRVLLDEVRLPASAVLGGGGHALALLFTTALSYGRMSVAWGCVGILRACLRAATAHAKVREQSGKPLAEHQLVAKHLASLFTAEQVATQACRQASERWDAAAPDMAVAAVLAKHVGATNAARSAGEAVQVLASWGAQDGHVVARAYRDAKLMEIIEGSNEISELILAEHALEHS